jgi:hypothetical protein
MKYQTTSYTILALGCIIPMILCTCGLWLPMYLNDRRLTTFADNLYEYPLPRNTVILDQRSELQKVGNGTNCDYKVEQSMVSTLPRTEVKQYYEGVMLPRVSFGSIWAEIYDGPVGTPIDLAFNESKSHGGASYFTLTILDFGFSDTGDIRCQ